MNKKYLSLLNQKNQMNGEILLEILPPECIKVAFFDPQYRGVLDKMSYGNEGKNRGQTRSSLPQMDEETIERFIMGIERVLLPNGYLFLWVDKFHLLEGVKPWLANTPSLAIVDMLTWDKERIGMGYRSRRRSEYLVVIQKHPRHAKKTWTLHHIPDVWSERLQGKPHTHSKPLEMQKQLILATTNEGDLVLDPASGGFSVFEACQATGRNFIGCDLVFGEYKHESD